MNDPATLDFEEAPHDRSNSRIQPTDSVVLNSPAPCADALVVVRPEAHERRFLTVDRIEYRSEDGGQPQALGSYLLLKSLGQGGMGQVFKALHLPLNRLVALKIVRRDLVSQDPRAVQRFQREALAAAQLTHPNVVTVYNADQIGDTFFIAMEYVPGNDLSRVVRETGPLASARACDYIRQAALGLQHAHEHGMVHRDIKPSNLIVSASGAIKILDMGLVLLKYPADTPAKDSSLTGAGTVLGTPEYIAPEQARDSHRVDSRADLYSLGCTFYYLLTGQPPFPSGNALEKLLKHQLDEPIAVDQLRPQVPPAVVGIVRRLMAKNPEDRYPSAAALAEALAALAEVDDRAPSTAAPVDPAVHSAPTVDRLTAPAARPVNAPSEKSTPKPIAVLPGHRGWVTALAFTPNRELLATAGVDEAVRIRNFTSRRPSVQSLPTALAGEVHALAFAPDSRKLAVGSGTLPGNVFVWELTRHGPRLCTVLQQHTDSVETLAFSPDGKLLASGGRDMVIRLWNMSGSDSSEWAVLKGHTGSIQTLAFAPDAGYLASGGQDGTIRLWSVGTFWCRHQAVLQGHRGLVNTVAFAPDGQRLVSGGTDETVRLWDLTKTPPVERAVLKGLDGVVHTTVFTPDGQSVLAIGDRGHVMVWDTVAGTQRQQWQLPELLVSSLAFTFDGRYLAAGKTNGNAVVFRLGCKRHPPRPVALERTPSSGFDPPTASTAPGTAKRATTA